MQISRRHLVLGGSAAVGLAATAGAQKLVPTSSQDLGPFYPLIRPSDEDADLTRVRGLKGVASGDPINVIGRLLDVKGNPVSGARVELWQANALGRYDHPGDAASTAALDPNFQGYASLVSDDQGRFRFRTIKPGHYSIGGGLRRTRHIHFDIRGRSERLITQMYFPGEELNDSDILLRNANPRESVMARATDRLSGDPNAAAFAWDVILNVG
ncbi:MAG TPA: protocatechuate 3,4-dioxygenase [Sphingomicrobium sp.]|nr:protocatechuate 3,4-dioxygenase [Sphingomicrobium sp.]